MKGQRATCAFMTSCSSLRGGARARALLRTALHYTYTAQCTATHGEARRRSVAAAAVQSHERKAERSAIRVATHLCHALARGVPDRTVLHVSCVVLCLRAAAAA